jgi:hypothetical protein
MIKRASWFVGGAVAGIAGAEYAKRKVKHVADSLKPNNVAKVTVGKVRQRGQDVADAVREGRHAMRAKEAELRAKLHRGDGAQPIEATVVPIDRSEEAAVILLRAGQPGPRRARRRPRHAR